MTLAEDMAADLAANQYDTDEHAVSVSYNGSSISALVEYGDDLEDSQDGLFAVAYLTVLKSDVASPAYRDPVIISSQTWYVQKIVKGDTLQWQLKLTRDERPRW